VSRESGTEVILLDPIWVVLEILILPGPEWANDDVIQGTVSGPLRYLLLWTREGDGEVLIFFSVLDTLE
jgi:hypothetical protein